MQVTYVRPGYCKGYNKLSANKGMFVVSDAKLKTKARQLKREYNASAKEAA